VPEEVLYVFEEEVAISFRAAVRFFFQNNSACISLLQGKLLYLTCHRKLLLLHQGDGMLLLNCNAKNCLWTSTQRKFWSSNCLEGFVCNCCNVQSLLEWIYLETSIRTVQTSTAIIQDNEWASCSEAEPQKLFYCTWGADTLLI